MATDLKKLNREALDEHNRLRAIHGCPKLSLSDKLATEAQQWAEYLAQREEFEHSACDDYGENLFWANSTGKWELSPKEGVKSWYDEIESHDFAGDFQMNSGHFTQLIWKSTQKAGFGFAYNANRTQGFMVGRYFPTGNVIGQFKVNVPRPQGSGKGRDPGSIVDLLIEPRDIDEMRDDMRGPKLNGRSSIGGSHSKDKLGYNSPVTMETDLGKILELHQDDTKTIDRLNEDALDEHNRLRALHGCPKLQFDKDLAKEAQLWAETLAQSGLMKHSQCKGYGENLYFKISANQCVLSGKEGPEDWYNEIKDHDFDGDFQPRSGHFTQLIWKSTVKAGFGVAYTPDRTRAFMVGRYWPPGNVMGQFQHNVPRPMKSAEQKGKRRSTIIELPPRNGKMDNDLRMFTEEKGKRRSTIIQLAPRNGKMDNDLRMFTREHSDYSKARENDSSLDVLLEATMSNDLKSVKPEDTLTISPAVNKDLEIMNQDVLKEHNRLRALHGCPKLEYDASLAREAQQWAEHLSQSGEVMLSQSGQYGENLYLKSSADKCVLTGKEVCESWYNEIMYHDFDEVFQPETGHFTQLIWKSSKRAGFGLAYSKNHRKAFFVGRYQPAGNVIGAFKANVPRLESAARDMTQRSRKQSMLDDILHTNDDNTDSDLMLLNGNHDRLNRRRVTIVYDHSEPHQGEKMDALHRKLAALMKENDQCRSNKDRPSKLSFLKRELPPVDPELERIKEIIKDSITITRDY